MSHSTSPLPLFIRGAASVPTAPREHRALHDHPALLGHPAARDYAPRQTAKSRRAASERGFTLVEMMTVVVMITILASAAIPLAARQLRDRRVQEVAQQVASTYQSARMRAMGRGSAILVRYAPGTPGTFTTLEAQRGPTATADGLANAGCAALPVSSCLTTAWNTPAAEQYRTISTLDWDDTDLTVVMNGGEALDICFTPGGRAFSAKTGETLIALTRAFTATVGRSDTTTTRSRDVLVLPNGASRLAL